MAISTIGTNSLTNPLTGLTSTTITTTGDASISGLTVGKGGGAVVSNTALGYQAALNNTTNVNGVFVGYQAGLNNANDGNTAVGYIALKANTSGSTNAAIGAGAMASNTSGVSNTAVGGVNALTTNTTGSYNVAVGSQSLNSNTTASNNTAVGYQAGYSNTGANSTFLGTLAGSSATNTTNSVVIGYNCQLGSATDNNELVIATSNATGKGSNTGYISGGGGGTYQGNNSATWSITSDKRLKKNIVDNKIGLSAITAIQVRNFEYRTKDEVTELPSHNAIDIQGVQLGAIAQEIQTILPECVKEESTGVMSVDTTNLTWYLINAVKELNTKVVELEAKLASK